MSLSALLQAAVAQLKTDLSLTDKTCGLQLAPGKPPTTCGQFYLSVWAAAWNPHVSPNQQQGSDENYEFNVTITQRTATIPDHLLGTRLHAITAGSFEVIARGVMVSLVKNRYTVLQSANALIPGVNKIVEPALWTGADASPIPVGPDWFGADPTDEKNVQAKNFGHIVNVHFAGARRPQTFTNME